MGVAVRIHIVLIPAQNSSEKLIYPFGNRNLYILKKILMGPRRGLEVMAKKFFPEPHGN
jgi:hypothetical protein